MPPRNPVMPHELDTAAPARSLARFFFFFFQHQTWALAGLPPPPPRRARPPDPRTQFLNFGEARPALVHPPAAVESTRACVGLMHPQAPPRRPLCLAGLPLRSRSRPANSRPAHRMAVQGAADTAQSQGRRRDSVGLALENIHKSSVEIRRAASSQSLGSGVYTST